jgi:uncharacterized tellurite resistance protein B-like protein
MFKKLFDDIMGRISAEDAAADERDAAIRMATAVLMVDVALVDSSFEEVEFERMLRLVKNHFGLSTQAAAELINAANAEVDELVSVHEFTELLHKHLNDDEKARVVELLWSTAYADGDLDKYENSLVLKVSDLLNVSEDVVMRLKREAR